MEKDVCEEGRIDKIDKSTGAMSTNRSPMDAPYAEKKEN